MRRNVTDDLFRDNTLIAYTEVLATRDAERDDAGIVVFRHWGTKQDGRHHRVRG